MSEANVHKMITIRFYKWYTLEAVNHRVCRVTASALKEEIMLKKGTNARFFSLIVFSMPKQTK